MNAMPRVSVISSVYEQRLTLRSHLESLCCQDYKGEWEILVCDDGSHHDMLSVIRAISFPDMRYIWQPDEGFRLSRSRNNGLRIATGDLVIFVDADVLTAPDFISRHVRMHSGQGSVCLGSRKWIFTDEVVWQRLCSFPYGPFIRAVLRRSLYSEREHQLALIESIAPWAACIGCNFSVFPRPKVCFDEAFVGWGFEDWEFVLCLSLLGYAIRCPERVDVVHVEFSPADAYRPRRPREPEEIARYVQNAVHLIDKHPTVDTTPVKEVLFQYRFDDKRLVWADKSQCGSREQSDHELLAFAQEWVRNQKGKRQSMVERCGPVAHDSTEPSNYLAF